MRVPKSIIPQTIGTRSSATIANSTAIAPRSPSTRTLRDRGTRRKVAVVSMAQWVNEARFLVPAASSNDPLRAAGGGVNGRSLNEQLVVKIVLASVIGRTDLALKPSNR